MHPKKRRLRGAGKVEDPPGESRWACRSTALEWLFRSDVVPL
jgi:hypothetical protein